MSTQHPNFNLKLNMAAFVHVVRNMKGKDGKPKKCIILPIEDNHVFEGEKGGLYVDITAFANKEEKFGNTHILKQGLPKEVYDSLSEEQRRAQPIFGNMAPWGSKGEAAANVQDDVDEDSDLPF